MALQSLRPAVGLARLLAAAGRSTGAASHSLFDDAASALSPGSSQEYKQQQRQWSSGAHFDALRLQMPTVVLAQEDKEARPQAAAPSFATAGLAASSRRPLSLLLPPRAYRGMMPALARPNSVVGPQVRNYQAWTAAQRYFVEGDHVIAAEVGRSLQFTGLDSGSFAPFVPYTLIAGAISGVFMVLPYLLAPSRVDLDKSSAYECGFDAFGEARQTFSVSFYLVSIMYLLFDIEIAYLFPYVMSHANGQMFWTMNLFLFILVTGFIYEWGVGALEWRE